MVTESTSITVRELIAMIQHDGWQLDERVSDDDFRQFRHKTKEGSVTIVGDLNLYVGPSALKHILKAAQLSAVG